MIERAHFHGLTVTGHLDSGNRNSVNPRDAIIMGIDRIEHFMGGDAFTADKSAYASYEDMTFDTPAFKKIAALYKDASRVLRRDAEHLRLRTARRTRVLTNYFAATSAGSSRRTCATCSTQASAAQQQRAVRKDLLRKAKRDQSVLRRRRR